MRSGSLSLVLAVVCAAVSAQVSIAQAPDTCKDLASLKLDGVEITNSALLPEGMQLPGPGGSLSAKLPAHCRVDGMMHRRKGVGGEEFGIGFQLSLPEAAAWNGDMMMQGGGGSNGVVNYPTGTQYAGRRSGLARGFAVVSTDTGHKAKGSGFDFAFRKDQQAYLDFAYQANAEVAEVSKQIIARYYARPASYSYFVGCSTGGREGMILSQRSPTEFNGIVSGDPAMRTGLSNLAIGQWIPVAYNQAAPKDDQGKPQIDKLISDNDRKVFMDALLNKCDARDGVADGMIFDPIGCDFDPTEIACKPGQTESCIAPATAAAIKKAFSGMFGRYPTATEIDVDKAALTASDPLVEPAATNLSTFSGNGGKLIFFHGDSDPWFSPLDTLQYYQSLGPANGGAEKVAEWSRIFLVPGMTHCAGGPSLDQFDMLGAVVNWVEKGIAPDYVNATGKSFPGRSRPLCAYPTHAQYIGNGSTEDAGNFRCQ
jgi:hypothetical protein